MSKDETAIKRIQNTFDCCGFNALADRAWPFPSKDIDARECQRRFDRTQSCAGPWRQAEQINAGLFLIVAAVIFLGKVWMYFRSLRTFNNAHTSFFYLPLSSLLPPLVFRGFDRRPLNVLQQVRLRTGDD